MPGIPFALKAGCSNSTTTSVLGGCATGVQYTCAKYEYFRKYSFFRILYLQPTGRVADARTTPSLCPVGSGTSVEALGIPL